MNMSMEYYTACEAYGATAHFLGEKVFAPAFGRGIDLHSTTGMGQFNGATHMMHEGAVVSASARVITSRIRGTAFCATKAAHRLWTAATITSTPETRR